MSQVVQDLFTSIAPKYGRLNTILSLGQDRRWRKIAARHLQEQRNILDLCAGTLSLTEALLETNPTARITAIDFSEAMLEIGMKKLPKEFRTQVAINCSDFYKWQPNITGVGERRIHSAGEVRVAAPRYDAVMCAYGMRNLDDNPAALQKIHQLLTNKGRLVILEFFRPDHWLMKFFHATYAQFVIPTIGRLISRHEGAYAHLRDSIRGFYTLDEYCQSLRETGFEVKVAKQLTGGISGLIVAEKSPQPPFFKVGQEENL
ncbi:MAG: class I SAM-dependent methyltransferase [Deltaproteobacteria bacterium]|nr:class I SAM-dependent methyltransferase [Deltaproteobacteria bacterium]